MKESSLDIYSPRQGLYGLQQKNSSMENSINVIIDDQLRTQTNKEEKKEENSQNELKSLENEASHDFGSESEGIDNDEVKYPKEKNTN